VELDYVGLEFDLTYILSVLKDQPNGKRGYAILRLEFRYLTTDIVGGGGFDPLPYSYQIRFR